ncbi:hypothetical protein A3Q56_03834 [Intoshia linei]|uniref:Uncharacterized protein n=1 Tax=Intoshia linei TaxID=1819745 RepID=A0A177B488_9BILA|nr:hypothetical protein A3Q56_03834 [Intoshia linei]
MFGLLFLFPHNLATSSGSTNLNSPSRLSHDINEEFALSDNNSNRNCHNCVCCPKYHV